MAVLSLRTGFLQLLGLWMVVDFVVSSPVSPLSAEDMADNGQQQLDSSAMQSLLKKLWKYEAETWKAKFEDADSQRQELEMRVLQLSRALQACQGSRTGFPPETEGQWHDVVASEGVTTDVLTSEAADQRVEEDLRALANKEQGDSLQHKDVYDTDFVIVPIEERSVEDVDSFIRITSPQDDDVSVHVMEPREAQEVTYRVPAHGVVQIPLNRVPRGEASTIQLQSDEPVKVQVLTQGNSPADGYNVIFVSSLGADYTLTEDDARFAVVALANDTKVEVAGPSGNNVYTVVLQQGQTFVSPTGSGPVFTGGSVSASKDVAVFSARPSQCSGDQGCSGRTLHLLQADKVERKAWNDCLISSSGCKKKRPRPG